MWYRIDITKLVLHLLPPVLRSQTLCSMLNVLTLPLRAVYEKFLLLKSVADNRLNISGHVIYLEKVMNDTFFLTDRQIYIADEECEPEPIFYLKEEQQEAPTFYKLTESEGYLLSTKGNSVLKVDIRIMVPSFLCTSLESQDADKYGWVHLRTIKRLLGIYKPAGKTYNIELYDYE